MNWNASSTPSQSGRRALITGGNSGVGFHTALELARCGAEVILPARNEAKSADAIRRIVAEIPEARLTAAVLDLGSIQSIRDFANFYGERFPGASLDLHINNAGVMALPQLELTVDGFERQFATNYLGPFALTALIFSHLKAQPGTRIVTVPVESFIGAKSNSTIYSPDANIDLFSVPMRNQSWPILSLCLSFSAD